ncbi:cytochrome c oxidase assembly factor CtaG [Bacillus timonensis]|nr:cytochrome c oxidase assembly factor CtaG [Bacillus timonensis]
MSLDIFGFRAMWSPLFFLIVLSIGILYFLIIGPYRSRFENSEPVSFKQKFFFGSGLILLYICKGSPLDLLGHLMFSAHMTQMALLYLAVPPLLILGTPTWLLQRIVDIKVVKPLLKFFSYPLVALILFNGLFSIYHIPLVFDEVKTSVTLHAVTTGVLFFTAFMMWFPLVNPLPEWQTLSGIKKVGYIFADGVLLTPACALIIFSTTPMYSTYTDPQAWANALELCVPATTLSTIDLVGPQMFNSLPLVEDQQLGGVIMKIIQEIVYGSILGYIFFAWARRERERENETSIMDPQPIE